MTSTPPPPVIDRTERTANPILLAVLVLALAGVAAAVWFAPNGLGPTIATYAIVALAFFGALGPLAFRLRPFAVPAPRAPFRHRQGDRRIRAPTVSWSPTAQSRILYANAAYRALSGGGELKPVERLFAGSPDVSESVYRLSQAAQSPAKRPARTCASRRRLAATARWRGIASASGRSRAPRRRAPRSGPSRTRRASTTGTRPSSRISSTRSTISTTRRPGSFRPSRTARSST